MLILADLEPKRGTSKFSFRDGLILVTICNFPKLGFFLHQQKNLESQLLACWLFCQRPVLCKPFHVQSFDKLSYNFVKFGPFWPNTIPIFRKFNSRKKVSLSFGDIFGKFQLPIVPSFGLIFAKQKKGDFPWNIWPFWNNFILLSLTSFWSYKNTFFLLSLAHVFFSLNSF